MKKSTSLILGILTTIIIFGLGVTASRIIDLNSEFIPQVFLTQMIELTLSVFAIYLFAKSSTFKFKFQKVKFKYYMYGILFSLAGFLAAQIIATILIKVSGFELDPTGNGFSSISDMNALHFFLFVFISSSICEEFLFRGFAQNFFEPLKSFGIRISKNIFISVPVLLSGILFGLAHLILLTSETSGPMVFRTVLFATTLGLIAGYFQEKHQSILPAIVIHMTGNLPGLIIISLL